MDNAKLEILDLAKQEVLDNPESELEFWHAWRQVVGQLGDDDSRQLDTAIHEAGHAVMCWLVECPFEYVTIVPREEEESLGHVLHAPFPEHLVKDINSGPCKASELYMDRRMIISLAGYAAECLYLEPQTPDSEQSKGDLDSAFDYTTYRFDGPEVQEEYINDMLQAAKESLLAFYLHLAVLAIELLQEKILQHDNASSLLSKVPIS
jgi:Peptidase family M41